MSKNINQVYMTNPITSNASTDLMYFGQSPYGATDDAAMTYANFSAQFSGTTTGTAHQVLVNGTSATPQHGAITLTTPQNIDTTSDVQFNSVHAGSMLYTGATIQYAADSKTIVSFTTDGVDTYSLNIKQGVDAAGVSLGAVAVGGGAAALILTATDSAVVVDAGPIAAKGEAIVFVTNASHFTTFNFPTTTSTLRTVTFQDADGTVAYLSDIPAGSPSALTKVDDTNVTLTLGGTPATALLEAVSITAGWTGTLSGTRGGTGVNNGASTITLGGSLTTSGSFASTFTMTGTTTVTFPTSGTLATTSQIPTGAALTKTDDTNVTLTLGGSPTTALVNAASLTLGWTGQLGLTRGGTNASLVASNGGIIYSTATAMAVLSGTATAGQMLQSGASAAPSWSTATFPSTATGTGKILRADGTNWVASTATFADTYGASTLLYSNGANTVTGLTTANSAVLVTNSTGVPAWSGTMTNGQVIIGSTGATPTAATLSAGTGISITNGAGSITVASTGVGSLVWNDVSGTTQAAAVNQGYIISNSSQTTVTLPATAAEGSVFSVQGKGAAGWILQMNTGQTCHLGSSATTSAGSLTSTNQWDSVSIVCVTANTTFAVTSVVGNLTVA